MTPSTPRLVAVWVPDWPLVALAFEAYECRRLGVPWEIAAWSRPPPLPRALQASPLA